MSENCLFELAQLEHIFREARKIRAATEFKDDLVCCSAQKIMDDCKYLLPKNHRFQQE